MNIEHTLNRYLPNLISDWEHDEDGYLISERIASPEMVRVWCEKIGSKYVVGRCSSGHRGKSVKCDEEQITDAEAEARKCANLKRSCNRAYRRVIDLCEGIKGDRMLTLTFQENIEMLDVALLAWKKFVQLAYDRLGRFDYVCVPEKQKRGAIHFHIVLNRFVDWRVVLHLWRSAVKTVSSLTGGIDIRKKEVRKNAGESKVSALARYVAKYVSKAFYCAGDCWGVGRKRYYSNVKIERIEVFITDAEDSEFINSVERDMYNEIVGERDLLPIFEKIFDEKFSEVVRKWSFVSRYSGFSYRVEGFLA